MSAIASHIFKKRTSEARFLACQKVHEHLYGSTKSIESASVIIILRFPKTRIPTLLNVLTTFKRRQRTTRLISSPVGVALYGNVRTIALGVNQCILSRTDSDRRPSWGRYLQLVFSTAVSTSYLHSQHLLIDCVLQYHPTRNEL